MTTSITHMNMHCICACTCGRRTHAQNKGRGARGRQTSTYAFQPPIALALTLCRTCPMLCVCTARRRLHRGKKQSHPIPYKSHAQHMKQHVSAHYCVRHIQRSHHSIDLFISFSPSVSVSLCFSVPLPLSLSLSVSHSPLTCVPLALPPPTAGPAHRTLRASPLAPCPEPGLHTPRDAHGLCMHTYMQRV